MLLLDLNDIYALSFGIYIRQILHYVTTITYLLNVWQSRFKTFMKGYPMKGTRWLKIENLNYESRDHKKGSQKEHKNFPLKIFGEISFLFLSISLSTVVLNSRDR